MEVTELFFFVDVCNGKRWLVGKKNVAKKFANPFRDVTVVFFCVVAFHLFSFFEKKVNLKRFFLWTFCSFDRSPLN